MASNPLCLPEILPLIFQWLVDDCVSLERACRVNSSWFEEATKVRWREAPLSAFYDMDTSRKQIYASKVCSVAYSSSNFGSIFGWDMDLEVLETMTFPRLKHFSLSKYPVKFEDRPGEVRIDQHFPPTLEKLHIGGGELPEILLNHTSIELPRLREFSMNVVSKCTGTSTFLKFIHSLPSIETIILQRIKDRVISDQVLTYFANQQGLVRLDFRDTFFARATVEDAIALASPPFKKLQCLALRINADSVPSLVRAISNGPMKDLTLYIMDDKGPILDHISSIGQLQSFKIFFCEDRKISKYEIMTLEKLKQLHSLTLHDQYGWYSFSDSGNVASSDMDDECMSHLTAHLEHLQELSCSIEWDLTIQSIISIAKNCPTLKKLEIFGICDFRPLVHTEEVLFPHLKRLTLVDMGVENLQEQPLSAKDIALLLRRHAPKIPLKGLDFFNHDPTEDYTFVEDILKHFNEDIEFETQHVDSRVS